MVDRQSHQDSANRARGELHAHRSVLAGPCVLLLRTRARRQSAVASLCGGDDALVRRSSAARAGRSGGTRSAARSAGDPAEAMRRALAGLCLCLLLGGGAVRAEVAERTI